MFNLGGAARKTAILRPLAAGANRPPADAAAAMA
jgi:hypothetical protein